MLSLLKTEFCTILYIQQMKLSIFFRRGSIRENLTRE